MPIWRHRPALGAAQARLDVHQVSAENVFCQKTTARLPVPLDFGTLLMGSRAYKTRTGADGHASTTCLRQKSRGRNVDQRTDITRSASPPSRR
jgi:hypothetical protein